MVSEMIAGVERSKPLHLHSRFASVISDWHPCHQAPPLLSEDLECDTLPNPYFFGLFQTFFPPKTEQPKDAR